MAGETTVNGDLLVYLTQLQVRLRPRLAQPGYSLGLPCWLYGSLLHCLRGDGMNSFTTSNAEALVFRRGHEPAYMRSSHSKSGSDVEETNTGGTTYRGSG